MGDYFRALTANKTTPTGVGVGGIQIEGSCLIRKKSSRNKLLSSARRFENNEKSLATS